MLLDVALNSVLAVAAAFDSTPATTTVDAPWPFSWIRVVLLCAWVYLCLHLSQQVETSPLVPRPYKPLVQVLSLFLGPLIFLGLVLSDRRDSTDSANPFAALAARIRNAIWSIWGAGSDQSDGGERLQIFDATGTELREIYGHGDKRDANRHVCNMTTQIIDSALQQRASDILIDPKDPSIYTVRMRIDGTLRTVQTLPAETCRAVINSVKAVSSMDISERRRAQDGAFTARKGEVLASFRVASAGALNGEKLSIRVLNQNAGRFTLVDIGILPDQRATITQAINKPSGMVLVCGPTGSGKTTTLYSMLNEIDRYTRNVITVEDPIEAHLADASQIEINPKADITFAKALRSILRQDPDVICVGEIRDEETAEIALRAAQTGHLVLATIHCDSNATALVRLLDLGISPILLSSGLSLLISQRLVRRLCERCKKPAVLTPPVARAFREKGFDITHIFDAQGCEACGGTGYHGRVAVCDLLPINDDLRAEIARDGAIAARLKTEGDKQGRTSLRTETMKKVVAGITSLDEVKRVIG